jgi:hypothetical protein
VLDDAAHDDACGALAQQWVRTGQHRKRRSLVLQIPAGEFAHARQRLEVADDVRALDRLRFRRRCLQTGKDRVFRLPGRVGDRVNKNANTRTELLLQLMRLGVGPFNGVMQDGSRNDIDCKVGFADKLGDLEHVIDDRPGLALLALPGMPHTCKPRRAQHSRDGRGRRVAHVYALP